MSFPSLKNQCLIAMPALAAPDFHQSVIYICEHSAEGAMGLVINRVLDLTVGDVFRQIGLPEGPFSVNMRPVHWGGPVQPERGFVLHAPVGNWSSSLPVSEEIALSTSKDILEALASGHGGPDHFLLALGYAGWEAGQLEAELMENSWLNVPATAQLLFEEGVDRRWHSAAKSIGVDLSLLSDVAGHA